MKYNGNLIFGADEFLGLVELLKDKIEILPHP
jgi:hypothetical protein